MTQDPLRSTPKVEWPTLLVLFGTYVFWGFGTWAWAVSWPASILITGWFIAQFSSVQHEVLHGHPFRNAALNEALVFPSLTLIIPFRRFRDTHLQHHHDPNLTDPYDDPESNFMDPAVWPQVSRPMQWLYRINNTLAGRMTIGTVFSSASFLAAEVRLLKQGAPGVAWAWALNLAGILPVLAWLSFVQMPFWAYAVSVYLGLSLLRIRTYLEHRAHEASRARTVIVEDKGPLALLFLNNNFHAVHHIHPAVPWYQLPGLYAARKDHYQRRNESYVYASYAQIFLRHFFKAKDPVPHPVWPVRKSDTPEA